jgi:hypothetical protein
MESSLIDTAMVKKIEPSTQKVQWNHPLMGGIKTSGHRCRAATHGSLFPINQYLKGFDPEKR